MVLYSYVLNMEKLWFKEILLISVMLLAINSQRLFATMSLKPNNKKINKIEKIWASNNLYKIITSLDPVEPDFNALDTIKIPSFIMSIIKRIAPDLDDEQKEKLIKYLRNNWNLYNLKNILDFPEEIKVDWEIKYKKNKISGIFKAAEKLLLKTSDGFELYMWWDYPIIIIWWPDKDWNINAISFIEYTLMDGKKIIKLTAIRIKPKKPKDYSKIKILPIPDHEFAKLVENEADDNTDNLVNNTTTDNNSTISENTEIQSETADSTITNNDSTISKNTEIVNDNNTKTNNEDWTVEIIKEYTESKNKDIKKIIITTNKDWVTTYKIHLRNWDQYNISVSPKWYSFYDTTVPLKAKRTKVMTEEVPKLLEDFYWFLSIIEGNETDNIMWSVRQVFALNNPSKELLEDENYLSIKVRNNSWKEFRFVLTKDINKYKEKYWKNAEKIEKIIFTKTLKLYIGYKWKHYMLEILKTLWYHKESDHKEKFKKLGHKDKFKKKPN